MYAENVAPEAVGGHSTPDASPRVAVIIILYRTADQLPHFLDSLVAQWMRNWRLIVVDNASPDESLSIVTKRPDSRISVIRNPRNLGFAKAANQGLRAAFAAGCDFCILMNIDTIFGPNFLGDFANARDALNAPVIVPRVMDAGRPGRAWYAGGHFVNGWEFENVHEQYDPAAPPTPRLVDFAYGCCLGLTRGALDRVGLLDESFFVYWEDVDLSLRLNQAGVPIYYVPEPSLLHVGAAASGGVLTHSQLRLSYRSYMQFLRKHFGLARALQVMARLIAKQVVLEDWNWRRLAVMTGAMLRGQIARLRPPPRIKAPESTGTAAPAPQ